VDPRAILDTFLSRVKH